MLGPRQQGRLRDPRARVRVAGQHAAAAAHGAREHVDHAVDHRVAGDEHPVAGGRGHPDAAAQGRPAGRRAQRDRPAPGSPQAHVGAQPDLAGLQAHVATAGGERTGAGAQTGGDRAASLSVDDAHDRRPAGPDAGGGDDQSQPVGGARRRGGGGGGGGRRTRRPRRPRGVPPPASRRPSRRARRRAGSPGWRG